MAGRFPGAGGRFLPIRHDVGGFATKSVHSFREQGSGPLFYHGTAIKSDDTRTSPAEGPRGKCTRDRVAPSQCRVASFTCPGRYGSQFAACAARTTRWISYSSYSWGRAISRYAHDHSMHALAAAGQTAGDWPAEHAAQPRQPLHASLFPITMSHRASSVAPTFAPTAAPVVAPTTAEWIAVAAVIPAICHCKRVNACGEAASSNPTTASNSSPCCCLSARKSATRNRTCSGNTDHTPHNRRSSDRNNQADSGTHTKSNECARESHINFQSCNVYNTRNTNRWNSWRRTPGNIPCSVVNRRHPRSMMMRR